MSHLISNPEYQKVEADFIAHRNDGHDILRTYKNEYQRSCDLILNTTGLSAVSALFYLLNEAGENIPWQVGNHYNIYVSHTAGDQIAEDMYSYYEMFVAPPKPWIFLRSVNLQGTISTNSWTESNVLYEASILHFHYTKLTIDIDAVGNENILGNRVVIVSGSK